MKNVISEIERKLDSNRRGDYINIPGNINQIINANVFGKAEYMDFLKESDSYVAGGHMVDPKDVKDNDIVISYYGLGNDGAEDSFIVGYPNQDTQQIALNRLATKIVEED